MSLILNLETATKNCSVSLAENGKIIALKELNELGYSHAENLHPFIAEVLKVSNKEFSELDAVAISKGPGSYTGLRIGVSAAKGLCFALETPLISVDTLQSLAMQVNIENGVIVPMLDARRMEVYSSVFDSNHSQIRNIQAEILTEDSFLEFLEKGKVYFVGDGVLKTKEIINHPNAVFIDDKLPSANEMAQLSYVKYKKSDTENVAYFEPFYLKDFVTGNKPKN
ncbi:tRNA (adenosine(37)-N6)-threonylcarbamoyltransferase complex dimerization subunit type 1 TsaB [Urechidicola croceus]|uniref:tRNA (Adenosine(37)-N6)-threonylcarbamoyltransferase complex dimerization subunit type 1 TsaB n=1 Tax=Urechidicola croceus TaxID=1850246 RepID=A0A1D8P8H1_9FLAO|nr:tRNA (adenosine(37)-N6)-threonylcarbamoyltransferase complex dimerization subunit type 1 TsaB [Urechidicola croceus]AOW20842.1 tRNA (adenosine(37)-N6)-threonylcarbamoyltransferase complex dimerization subunit type 1 TsaB [Urechidicola croceus]